MTRPRALVIACAGLACALSLAACGEKETVATTASGQAAVADAPAAAARDEASGSASGSGDQVDPTAPLPRSRARLVSPVAGESTDPDAAVSSDGSSSAEDDMSLPEPKGPASKGSSAGGSEPAVSDLQVDKATALPNGVALPPLEAPEQVMDIIRAGNTIARSPYKWGGGHGSFQDNGYDCSGSVSYALYAAGLIGGSATSGQLMHWGRPGKGRWITVYANGGHTFMEVAGIRFDTSGQRVTGSRWQNEFRSTGGFVARHPAGL